MPASLHLTNGLLFAFLLVLARVAGVFARVPLPGMRAAPEPARAALAVGVTLALFARWPSIDATGFGPGRLAAWALGEAATGLAIGVAVAVVLEVFPLAAQILGLQAGYAYASTIDPNTQADSGILLVLAQLAAGLMFFAAGGDREVVRWLAASLDQAPPGTFAYSAASAPALIGLAARMFAVGLRLALPVVALLVMVDLSLALLGRLSAQLQLLSLAFPVKMLVGLAMLAASAVVWPRLLREMSAAAWQVLRRLPG